MKKIIKIILLMLPFGLISKTNVIEPELVSDLKFNNLEQLIYIEHNGKFFMNIEDRVNGLELWVFDDESTSLKKLNNVNPEGNSNPRIICTNLDDVILFIADDENGTGLWVTDGTDASTKLIRYIENQMIDRSTWSINSSFFRFGGEVYFIAIEKNNYKSYLWKSDGTPEGTQIVNNNIEFGFSTILDAKRINNNLVFRTYNYSSKFNNVWSTDGTVDNTYKLPEFSYYSFTPLPYNFREEGGLFYVLKEVEYYEVNLWATDGTMIGSNLLKTFNIGTYLSEYLTYINQEMIFTVAVNDSIQEIWCSDGTLEGTRILKSLKLKDGYLIHYKSIKGNNRLIFTYIDMLGVSQLGITDATPEGTLIISNDKLFPLKYYTNLKYNDRIIYFGAESEDSTYTLWATDGKKDGSYQVFNSNLKTRDRSIVLHQLLPDNRLLFEFRSKSNDEATTWVTDGTEKGTFKLTDERINRSIQLNGNVYFRSEYDEFLDVPHQSNLTKRGTQAILPSDATNTKSIMSYLTDFYSFNDHIYFFADYYGKGQQLYRIPNTISSVEDTPQQELMTVYPNPAKDYIQLELSKPMQLSIINSTGAKVKDYGAVTDGKLNVAELHPGVYFVVDEQGKNIAKFVKE